MAWKGKKNQLLATLVTEERAPCAFCRHNVDDEVTYGKLYAIGDIQCHYFCVLLSCCLIQKGKDEQGLFGFMYPDILAEVDRSKKHKCSYCGKEGASLGCSISQCRKQFHLPCGRARNAVSLFYGNYKSFCENHAKKQKIPDHIMSSARIRMKQANILKKLKSPRNLSGLKELYDKNSSGNEIQKEITESVCVICYEAVDGFPTLQTFWPPCCARDAWFHRTCLQRMALSAGMHYLKCPLCNDKESFYEAVVEQGYYVPDRDAAWELEQNAFAEIYERPLSCSAEECQCPMGRNHDTETGSWDIKLCILCGTLGLHAQCLAASGFASRFVCDTCKPAAPEDMDSLVTSIKAVILQEQARSRQTVRRGTVMPSRMSLRRTKQRIAHNTPSTSQLDSTVNTESEAQEQTTDTSSSRLELNLKTPTRPTKSLGPTKKTMLEPSVLKNIENKFLSPKKLFEQVLNERIRYMGVREIELDSRSVVDKMSEKFNKPRPLCEKKRIVNQIVERLLINMFKESSETCRAVKQWVTPKKNCEITTEAVDWPQENIVPTTGKVEQDIEFEKTLEPLQSTPVKIDQHEETPPEEAINQIVPPTIVDEKSQQAIENLLQENIDPTTGKVEQDIEFEKTLESLQSTPVEIDQHEETPPEEDINQIVPSTIVDEETQHAIECVTKHVTPEKDTAIIEDESSSSTFQLPPEFIADCNSEDSLSLCDTPKKLKTVEIQKDSSLEISENDEVVIIDVVKMEDKSENKKFLLNFKVKSPVRNEKCVVKFSPADNEILGYSNVGVDLESFRKQYLNEIDKDYRCSYSHCHKHINEEPNTKDFKLRTAIDFAIDATFQKDKNSEGNCTNENKNPEENCTKEDKDSERCIDEEKKTEIPYTQTEKDCTITSKTEDKDPERVYKNKKNVPRRMIKIKPRYAEGKFRNNSKELKRMKIKRKLDMAEQEPKKRKIILDSNDGVTKKKRIITDNKSNADIEIVSSDDENVHETVDITVDTTEMESKNQKRKNKKLKKVPTRRNIKVKIKWKKEQLRLKITKSQTEKFKKRKLMNPKTLKQYVLNYCEQNLSPDKFIAKPNKFIAKPEKDVTPMKRKYEKQEKTPDNLVQTSIQKFFQVKRPETS